MLEEQRKAGKRPRTPTTHKLFHAPMGLAVSPEVRLVCKGSMALAALEWLLSGVGAQMSLQQPWPGEAFVAQRAMTRQCVGLGVNFEGSQSGVALVTVLTLETLQWWW